MKFGIREIIFVVLLMAIPVGAWWFVFRPGNMRNAEMMKQIEAKQEKLRAINQATATMGDLKKEIEALSSAIGFFHSKLPTEKEMDKVLQEVWQLAEFNKLTTKSIRALERDDEKGYTSLAGPYSEQPIVMQLEGDFMGFYAFLLALEGQPRIMRIRSMEIIIPENAPEGYMQVKFIMSIFFENSQDETWNSNSTT